MIYNPAFLAQIPNTLAFEGGYVDDPTDPGGETNFGISKAAYPSLDIANISRDMAISIYYRDYWLKPNIGALPDFISGKVFDMGVNMGPVQAIRLLQQTLGIDVDGIIGPITIHNCVLRQSTLLNDYRSALLDHYQQLVDNHPAFAKYLRGWSRRAVA